MRARTIELGRDYLIRVRLAPVKRLAVSLPHRGGPGWPGWHGRRRVTVVATTPGPGRYSRVVVEAIRWEAINAHWFDNPSAAMLAGQLRYRPRPHRWTIPVRDVLTPTDPTTSDAGDAGAGDPGRARLEARA